MGCPDASGWSFVGKKDNPRWTWYLIERESGLIIGWENGSRQDKVLQNLINKISHLPIRILIPMLRDGTDNWGAYHPEVSGLLPCDYHHLTGKDETWKIERKNLNFRTHIKRLKRKTICFSKNERIHPDASGCNWNVY